MRRSPALVVSLLVLVGPATATAAPTCTTATTAGTTVEICLDEPAPGATLSGDAPVTARAVISGSAVTKPRVVIALDAASVISDYEAPFTITLPTRRFADGPHTLSASVKAEGGFSSQTVDVAVAFANGGTPPPPNAVPFVPRGGPAVGQVVAAYGDAAGGMAVGADVTNLVSAWNPARVLYLGDIYNNGSATEYLNWVGGPGGRFMGTFKDITNPVVGNHEYGTQDAAGYDDYWGPGAKQYTFDVGGWRFVVANSNCAKVSCDAGGASYTWLEQQLQARANDCVVLLQHHPRFSIGPQRTSAPILAVDPFWRLAVTYGVELVLTGHEHSYQRFVPLNGDGVAAAGGPEQIIIGTGGHDKQSITLGDGRVAFALSEYGAMRMLVAPESITYDFVDVAGAVRDSGRRTCATSPPPAPPDPVATLTATPGSAGTVTLEGSITANGVAGTWALSITPAARPASTGTFASTSATAVSSRLTKLVPGSYTATLAARVDTAAPVEATAPFVITGKRPRFAARARIVVSSVGGRRTLRCTAPVTADSWPTPRLTYAWIVGKSRVVGKNARLRVSRAFVGKSITCRATARSTSGTRLISSRPLVLRR